MGTETNQKYSEAMKKSYTSQEGGITIPATEVENIVTIPLGFQPLGIASQYLNGKDRIAIAAYFEPAVCLAEVDRDHRGLHFRVSWIRGADHGVQSIRLFPDVSQPAGANRLQTVNFGPNDTIWITRNSERYFYILSPPIPGTNRWTLTGKVTLPDYCKEYHRLESAVIDLAAGKIYTIETTADLEHWHFSPYIVTGGSIKLFSNIEGIKLQSWVYGIGVSPSNEHCWFITDFRSKVEKGIYHGSDHAPAIPNIYGNGICFLSDGSALVTRYGQASPGAFNGEPGALIYIPARLFKYK